MAVLGEIEDALAAAADGGAPAVGLMQCTSVYPAPAERINLRAMATMERAFGVPVGLSDHSLGHRGPDRRRRARRRVRREALHARPHDDRARPPVRARAGRAARDGRRHPRRRRPRSATAARTGPSPEEREEMYPLGRRSLIAARDLPAGTRARARHDHHQAPGLRHRAQAPRARRSAATLKVDVEEDEILHLGDGLEHVRAPPRSPCPARPRSAPGSTAATGSPRSSPRPPGTAPARSRTCRRYHGCR